MLLSLDHLKLCESLGFHNGLTHFWEPQEKLNHRAIIKQFLLTNNLIALWFSFPFADYLEMPKNKRGHYGSAVTIYIVFLSLFSRLQSNGIINV